MAYLIDYQRPGVETPLKEVVTHLETALKELNQSILRGLDSLSKIKDLESESFGVGIDQIDNPLFTIGAAAPWNYAELINQYRQCRVILKTLQAMDSAKDGDLAAYTQSLILGMSPSQQGGLDVFAEAGGRRWGLECYGGVNVTNNNKILTDAKNLFENQRSEIDIHLFSCYHTAFLSSGIKTRDGIFERGPSKYGRYQFRTLNSGLADLSVFEVQQIERPTPQYPHRS